MSLQERANRWVHNCIKDLDLYSGHEYMPYDWEKIYSYGEHWVLAHYYKEHNIFIVNISHYSPSTANHLRKLLNPLNSCEVIALPFGVEENAFHNKHASSLLIRDARDNIKRERKRLQELQERGRVGSGAYLHRAQALDVCTEQLKDCKRLEKLGWQ